MVDVATKRSGKEKLTHVGMCGRLGAGGAHYSVIGALPSGGAEFPPWRGIWLRIGIALCIEDYNQHMRGASADQLRSYHDN